MGFSLLLPFCIIHRSPLGFGNAIDWLGNPNAQKPCHTHPIIGGGFDGKADQSIDFLSNGNNHCHPSLANQKSILQLLPIGVEDKRATTRYLSIKGGMRRGESEKVYRLHIRFFGSIAQYLRCHWHPFTEYNIYGTEQYSFRRPLPNPKH